MKTDSITTIDCKYVYDEFVASYLMIEGNEALFVDNNTNFSVPILLKALEERNIPFENVKYLIITHIHLDHAGGTSGLLPYFPNAKVLAHPKAAPHVINPKRIVESASMVYGKEAFTKLYGEIKPVSEDRVRVMQDGEELQFGERTLKFIYTRGHANHHFVIYDSKTNSIFTGDSFGISYPWLQKGKGGFLFLSTTPTDFHAEEARLSVQKILNTGAERAYLTHYDAWTDMQDGASQLLKGIEKMEVLLKELAASAMDDAEMQKFAEDKIRTQYENDLASRGITINWDMLKADISINAMGIVFAAKRARKKDTA